MLAGFTLSGWAMALVVRRWTGSTLGGVTAGMLYAFNAHLLTRLVHLQALHMEFLPFALFAFDRVLHAAPGSRARRAPGHAGQRSAARRYPAAALAACAFILQALCSNYTLVFLSVALVTAAAVARTNGSGQAGPIVSWRSSLPAQRPSRCCGPSSGRITSSIATRD